MTWKLLVANARKQKKEIMPCSTKTKYRHDGRKQALGSVITGRQGERYRVADPLSAFLSTILDHFSRSHQREHSEQ